MDSLITPTIRFEWPRWVEICTFVSHFFLALNASVNILLFCSCDKRLAKSLDFPFPAGTIWTFICRFFVVVQKTLKSWFVWPVTTKACSSDSANQNNNNNRRRNSPKDLQNSDEESGNGNGSRNGMHKIMAESTDVQERMLKEVASPNKTQNSTPANGTPLTQVEERTDAKGTTWV